MRRLALFRRDSHRRKRLHRKILHWAGLDCRSTLRASVFWVLWEDMGELGMSKELRVGEKVWEVGVWGLIWIVVRMGGNEFVEGCVEPFRETFLAESVPASRQADFKERKKGQEDKVR